MIAPEEIVRIFEIRRRNRGGYIQKMVEVQRMYDGDIWVPLPELDENERPGVANLLLQGVEQLGMRASSVLPDTTFLPLRPGIDKWEAMARDQRRALPGLGGHERSDQEGGPALPVPGGLWVRADDAQACRRQPLDQALHAPLAHHQPPLHLPLGDV